MNAIEKLGIKDATSKSTSFTQAGKHLNIYHYFDGINVAGHEIKTIVFVSDADNYEIVYFIEMYYNLLTDKQVEEVKEKFRANPDSFKNV